MTPTIHLVGNAHLDPVWLWDWREGLTEAISTTRTILDIMDERPELTFARGESLIYRHIEVAAPDLFRRILDQVRAGRWDVVGGTYLQADENLPDTATHLAQFERGAGYFAEALGVRVRAAWSPDAYGHSGGYPEILAAAGIEYFAFTRPGDFPLPSPLFRWRGRSGATILSYRMSSGWYGCERDEIPRRLDGSLAELESSGLGDVACLYGLGNHGGGPTRRHLDEIAAWAAAHPEVRVVHSGLHRFFDTVAARASTLPVVEGELNFSLRGTYVSHAGVKRAYRRAESELERAERLAAAVAGALDLAPPDLDEAREGVLFNSFHDIVTGSSTERVLEDQLSWLGHTHHLSQRAALSCLTALAGRVDTSVPAPGADRAAAQPHLVFNPHPHPWRGPLELEGNLDYRPIAGWRGRATEVPLVVRDARGKVVPHQLISPEHLYAHGVPWRMRVLVDARVPALGYAVYSVGLEEGRRTVTGKRRPSAAGSGSAVSTGTHRVWAKTGGPSIRILRHGKSLLARGGLHVVTVSDPWGSEGGMRDEPESVYLDRVVTRWKVVDTRVLERGPLRTSLWVRLGGGGSWLDLTFRLTEGRDAVDVEARLLWNERSARLKLVLPWGDEAQFEVPGGWIRRPPSGQVPGLRWVRLTGPRGALGFASDSLYGFDCADGELRVSVARATRYGADAPETPTEAPWHPVGDRGELKFRFLLCPGGPELERHAQELDLPLLTLPVPASAGKLAREGSFARLEGARLRLIRLTPRGRGAARAWIQNTGERTATGVLYWLGDRRDLPSIPPGAIHIVDLPGGRPPRA